MQDFFYFKNIKMRKKNVTLRNKEIQYLPILNQVTAVSDIQRSFSLWPRVQIFESYFPLLSSCFFHLPTLGSWSWFLLYQKYSLFLTPLVQRQLCLNTWLKHLPLLILFWFPKWKWPLTPLNYYTFCTLTWNYCLYLVIGLCILHSSTWV